jgi:hypothetical protein
VPRGVLLPLRRAKLGTYGAPVPPFFVDAAKPSATQGPGLAEHGPAGLKEVETGPKNEHTSSNGRCSHSATDCGIRKLRVFRNSAYTHLHTRKQIDHGSEGWFLIDDNFLRQPTIQGLGK